MRKFTRKNKLSIQPRRDVTVLYIKGAYVTLGKAQEANATVVILKEYSPSCGSSMIYNGEFKGKKIVGNGVTTALLKRNGIQVVSEEILILLKLNIHERHLGIARGFSFFLKKI
ncbi:DUF523 domain-containing protein [Neobacillus sp. PS3-12]|uniref:DUF523 domain-containing protein n=1 Tax=Neobacillus sp. PS3-12 TaxID=3070677 RepID=UPI0027E1A461|nr:DUF523 domain-containing protein [Neobacillus sp. PS3-12]WML55816.1 DUF523 domain-containing protein [Neobacillus sp. PS3-12]